MPFVNCVLAMCDTPNCDSKEVVPLLNGPHGPGAALPKGWVSSPIIRGPHPSMTCKSCQNGAADQKGVADEDGAIGDIED